MNLETFLNKRHVSRAGVLAGLAILLVALVIGAAYATGKNEVNAEHAAATSFLWIAILLLVAKMASLIERFGQPAVLGELVAGIALGNAGLVGLQTFEGIKHDEVVQFLAELGVVVLLFQIGLESNITKMRAVGWRAFLVATVGVVAPFVLGTYMVGPWLIPDLSKNAYLFLGATLTATSVGITARVFKDLNYLHKPEAQIVLGAAVIDDVMGLIILAVISAIVTIGGVSSGMVALITGKAILFLIGSIVIGQILAPRLGRLLSRVHGGAGMKFTLAISFGLIFAWLATLVGLAPIVGAFAAGLLLDPVHFRPFKEPRILTEIRRAAATADKKIKSKIEAVLQEHAHRHVDELIEPIGFFLVPIFFIATGMQVNLATFASPALFVTALVVTVVAFAGKIISGLVAGKVNKLIVGCGMIPRGEVGLIFAAIGKSLGVVSEDMFSIIVIMIMLSTLVTPIILTWLIKRLQAST